MTQHAKVIAFTIGFCSALLSPSIALTMTGMLLHLYDPNAGPLSPGPICNTLAQHKAASPNGRFIVNHFEISCEDDLNWPQGYHYILIVATRQDRAAHVMTLPRKPNEILSINWENSSSISVISNQDNQIDYFRSWCGVSVIFLKAKTQ